MRTQWREYTSILLGSLIMLGAITGRAAAAALTAKNVVGRVEYVEERAPGQWMPVIAGMTMERGQLIRTAKLAALELVGADGSVLNVDEETQIAISAFDFSEATQTRVSKFKLLIGTLVAKARPLQYKTNVFEVETPNAVAGLKFSSASITVDENGNTTISIIEGIHEITATTPAEGDVIVKYVKEICCNFTELVVPEGNTVIIEITEEGMKLENKGPATLHVTISGVLITIPPGASIETFVDDDNHLTVQNTSPLTTGASTTVQVDDQSFLAGKTSQSIKLQCPQAKPKEPENAVPFSEIPEERTVGSEIRIEPQTP